MQQFNVRMIAALSVLGFGQFAIAASRDLYVSSEGTNSIKRFDGITGAYIGDFVAPGSGGLSLPQGCLFGPDGNLYVTGGTNTGVLRYNGTTGAFMGTFTSGASLGFGADMSFHNGSLYVSDFSQVGHVYKFDATTGVFQSNFALDNPRAADGETWDAAGNLYVSSFGNGAVRKYNSAGVYQGDFATLPTGGKPLDNRFGADGNFYVNDFPRGTVDTFDGTTGAYLGDFITGLGTTQGQEIGPDGGLYVGSYQDSYINEYNASSGALIRRFASGGGLTHVNNFAFGPVAAPEPASLAAVAIGLGLMRRRRSAKRASLRE